MNGKENLIDAIAQMEGALAAALEAANAYGTPEQIEAILRLIIKKEIILELLLDEALSLE
ncbi:hypothetical protein [Fervidibacillus halotolerans]|uniref:Uncharacterized protein n=1 Tax=Fervidibacillus halotolerans TaxID=2980027 RepID=A0A9E8M0G9_9BACI|nr:hypothetical protein [Fervidibacillus halotolerans]WAA13135.1 hypothetical protein OE105_03120 [Fervidibacillus halotolerans]